MKNNHAPCAEHCAARGFERELVKLRAALSTACAQRDTYRAALRKISDLRPGAGNSKLHGAVQVAFLALNDPAHGLDDPMAATGKESLTVATDNDGTPLEAA